MIDTEEESNAADAFVVWTRPVTEGKTNLHMQTLRPSCVYGRDDYGTSKSRPPFLPYLAYQCDPQAQAEYFLHLLSEIFKHDLLTAAMGL